MYLEDVVELAYERRRFFLILHSKKRIYLMITILDQFTQPMLDSKIKKCSGSMSESALTPNPTANKTLINQRQKRIDP